MQKWTCQLVTLGAQVTLREFSCRRYARPPSILFLRDEVISTIRFLWNATSGSRLRPWRSQYLKWRIETYSGMKADSITLVDILQFTWREKRNLVHFLKWAGKLEREASITKA